MVHSIVIFLMSLGLFHRYILVLNLKIRNTLRIFYIILQALRGIHIFITMGIRVVHGMTELA